MDAPSDDELVTLRRRVESRPTDLQAHFELGAALCLRGDYVTGMPELQQAMASPTVRFPAMALLADAFDSTGMKEMAARMRQRILGRGTTWGAIVRNLSGIQQKSRIRPILMVPATGLEPAKAKRRKPYETLIKAVVIGRNSLAVICSSGR